MFSTQFVEKIQETPTDWSFRFTKPEGFSYKAGQYSVIRMPMLFPDDRHGARTCSFSSSPTEDLLQFTFTVRETGFKRTLMSLEPGAEAIITPARGFLTLDNVTTPTLCMIAGGIGVAPFRSIAKYLLDTGTTGLDAVLLYSDKDHHEIAFAKEWSQFTNLSTYITLTRLQPEHSWDGLQGRIDWGLIESAGLPQKDVTYMICGSPDMVRGTQQLLLDHSIKPEQIIIELFTGY